MRINEILILRALNGLGDFICATPALRALRQLHPAATISFVGPPGIRGVAMRYPHLVDRFIAFPGFPGIPEVPFDRDGLIAFLGDLSTRPTIDLAVQMHGDGTVANSFLGLMGAGQTAGLHLGSLWCPDPATYLPYPHDAPEPLRWLRLAAHLGADTDPTVEFPISDAERATARDLAPAAGRYAVLHPGASQAERRWSPQAFAAVGDALAAAGLRIVVTGTAAEYQLAQAVTAAMRTPAFDLSGATDLGTMAALIESADLVVTNDTGTSHLAAATRTRSVVVFTGSDRVRWAPLDGALHRAVGDGQPDATPMRPDRPPPGRPPHPDEIIAAATDLLEMDVAA